MGVRLGSYKTTPNDPGLHQTISKPVVIQRVPCLGTFTNIKETTSPLGRQRHALFPRTCTHPLPQLLCSVTNAADCLLFPGNVRERHGCTAARAIAPTGRAAERPGRRRARAHSLTGAGPSSVPRVPLGTRWGSTGTGRCGVRRPPPGAHSHGARESPPSTRHSSQSHRTRRFPGIVPTRPNFPADKTGWWLR